MSGNSKRTRKTVGGADLPKQIEVRNSLKVCLGFCQDI